MKIKKVLKWVGIVLLIIMAIILINTIRNFVIVKGLQSKIGEYKASTNYAIKLTSKVGDETQLLLDYYVKDNKKAGVMNRISKDQNVKVSFFRRKITDDGEKYDVFWETPEEKTVQINTVCLYDAQIYNSLETDNTWQTILACTLARIKSTECNGKKCYKITNYMSPLFLNGTERNEAYVEKETGLGIRIVMDDQVTDKEYSFGNVDDSVFVEPNIGEYKIKE